MKIDRAKLTIQVETQFDKKWVGFEATVEEDDDPIKALHKLEEIIHSYHSSTHRNSTSNDLPVIQVNQEKRNIGITTEVLLSCNDLKSIDIYKGLIKGSETLEKAYMKRREELVEIESQDILNKTNESHSKK